MGTWHRARLPRHYHGTLVGEVVRRVTGSSLGQFFRSEVAHLWGSSSGSGFLRNWRTALYPCKRMQRVELRRLPGFVEAASDPGTLTYRVVNNPSRGRLDFNRRDVHACEMPSANGIASARALARMYAACIAEVDGIRLIDSSTLAEACRVHTKGLDLVLLEQNSFGMGFYLPFQRLPFAGPTSFGHDGAGGAVAFADRASGISFAFLTDLIPARAGADPDARLLIDAALACAK